MPAAPTRAPHVPEELLDFPGVRGNVRNMMRLEGNAGVAALADTVSWPGLAN